MMNRSIWSSISLFLLVTFSSVAFAKEPVPISMWIGSQPVAVAEWLSSFETEFNRTHPDIKLELMVHPSVGTMRDKVVTSTVAGIGPDIFYEASNYIGKWILSDLARPIDNFINAKSDKADFIPDIFKLLQWKKQTYAFPFVSWPIFTLYNLDLFVQVGVSEPQTWDDMINAARKLTRSDSDKTRVYGWRTLGNNSTLAFGDLELSLQQLGSTSIEPDALDSTIDTAEALRAMRYLYELRQAGMPEPIGGTGMKEILAGQVAIQHWASTSVDFNQALLNVSLDGHNFGLRRFIGPSIGKDMIVAFAGTWVLSKASKHPDEAWQVIESFCEPSNMRNYLVAREYNQTVRRSQANDPVLLKIPFQKELMELMRPPLTTSGSTHLFYTEFRDPVGKILLEALQGRSSIKTVLIEADRIMDAIVQSENDRNGKPII